MKRKNSIKHCLWLLLLLFLSAQPITAQAQAEIDTTLATAPPAWQQRHFSEETIKVLEEDRHMDYALAKADESWWTNFKRWLGHKLGDVLDGASGNGLMDMLFYVFCIGAGIFIVIRFLDINASSLFHRKAAASAIGVSEGITENIHELNFEKEVTQAVKEQDYRRAVRLLYLASLKRLADADHIRWEPGKTNRQYQREVKAAELSAHFARLGYYFEYAWYGDFAVDEPLFRQVEQEYDAFCRKVGVAA